MPDQLRQNSPCDPETVFLQFFCARAEPEQDPVFFGHIGTVDLPDAHGLRKSIEAIADL
jgi:hypothetical protein